MILGADQLSKGITSATWHAMLDDHREAAYQVMQTIALKQGIDRIRMFNRAGQVMFSTNAEDQAGARAAGERGPVRIACASQRGRDGTRRLEMLTPIYNEPSCSQAACHAHPAGREGARCARSAAEPRKRRPRSRRHEVPRAAGDRRRNHAHQPVHHLFHAPLPRPPHRQADRRHQGHQPDGTRQAARHRRQQRGARRAGALLRRDARPPAHRPRRDQPVHPEPGNQGRRAHPAAQGGAEEAPAERPPGLARTALRQRGARDQQPDLRRAQPLHAAAAHAQRRRRPARAASPSSASTWGR